jgi:transposase
MELTDAQWAVVEALLPEGKSGPGRKGRPRRGNREVLEGILWVLRTGARWRDLPPPFPPYQTCHRRFGQWSRGRTLEGVLKALVADMQARGGIDLSEAYIDGSFAGAKRGVVALVQQSEAKGARSWQLRTAMAFLSPSGLAALRHMK